MKPISKAEIRAATELATGVLTAVSDEDDAAETVIRLIHLVLEDDETTDRIMAWSLLTLAAITKKLAAISGLEMEDVIEVAREL